MSELYKCSTCGAEFDEDYHFDNHIWKAHGGAALSRLDMEELSTLRARVKELEEALEKRPPIMNCNTPGYIAWDAIASEALQERVL